MGKTGKEVVSKYYTWDSIAAGLEKKLKAYLVKN